MSEASTAFVIEKGVPLHPSGKWQTILHGMEVGDSIVVQSSNERISILRAAAAMGAIARSRKCPEGFRVWRVS